MLRSCVVALVALSSAANAAPVMLNCELTQEGGPLTVNVQLNEAAGTVSYSLPATGVSVEKSAIFAPDHVSFGGFWVSRTDLTFKRINDGEYDQSIFHMPPVNYGNCALDTRKRAF